MLTTSTGDHRVGRHARFTLVEMLVVMVIILLMVGLEVTASKGGASWDATKEASVVAAGEFDEARRKFVLTQQSAMKVSELLLIPAKRFMMDNMMRDESYRAYELASTYLGCLQGSLVLGTSGGMAAKQHLIRLTAEVSCAFFGNCLAREGCL